MFLIFLRAYSEGHLPSSWKSSLVIPIFKKGERFDALNYHPISTTSVCSKTFERLLCEDLTNYLESNNILSPHQFGFRAHRSTMDQLLMVYDSVSKSMDRGGVTDLIFLTSAKPLTLWLIPCCLRSYDVWGSRVGHSPPSVLSSPIAQ